jgi:hypothetical protein
MPKIHSNYVLDIVAICKVLGVTERSSEQTNLTHRFGDVVNIVLSIFFLYCHVLLWFKLD